MDTNAPTTSTVSTKRDLRLLWRVCWAAVLTVLVWAGYLMLTSRPAFYSPATAVRKNGAYIVAMHPPPPAAVRTNAPSTPASLPTITISTNPGGVRIEYPHQKSTNTATVLGLTLHHVEGGEVVRLGGTTVQLKRIGHAWLPPKTNAQNHYHGNVPAQFYRTDLRPLTEAEVNSELPEKWQRLTDFNDNRHGYRFDFEIKGDPWKVLSVSVFDARTQTQLTHGSSSSTPKNGFWIDLEPHLWHSAPLELVMDITTGPSDTNEIVFQPGASFSVGTARYDLIYAGDNLSGSYYSFGDDTKNGHLELSPPPAHQRTKESVVVFLGQPAAAKNNYDLDFLDAAGKKLEAHGPNISGVRMHYGVQTEVSKIHKLRVRSQATGHRLVFHLHDLPGLPAENKDLSNLFAAKVPLLRFDHMYEQEEYIRRMTQLEMVSLPTTNLPSGTYPRWFTNVTHADVLEDYALVRGVSGQLFVNQQTLRIEQGTRPWSLELQDKLQKLWKKLKP